MTPEGFGADSAADRIEKSSEVIQAISSLEGATRDHIDWLQTIHRLMACDLPIEDRLTDDHAHHLCNFGKWLADQDDTLISRLGAFGDVISQHEKVHVTATRVLNQFREKKTVDPNDYDAFMQVVGRFNQLLRGLQSEVWKLIAVRDPLTGLRNRQGMEMDINRDIQDASPLEPIGTICMCDLDHFKKLNDTYGHAGGDEVLRGAAQTIRGVVRPSDVIYRYGGEEILVYLRWANADSAEYVCERMRVAIEDMRVYLPDGGKPPVTASFGLAEIEEGSTAEETIVRADSALYAAKENGRNRAYRWLPDGPERIGPATEAA